jgi:hypothetical protein
MKVAIDQVWATPSTLHCRVLVFADDGSWRHKYYASIPADEIEESAIIMLTQAYLDAPVDETKDMEPLF